MAQVNFGNILLLLFDDFRLEWQHGAKFFCLKNEHDFKNYR